jgi:hypothetical protein
MKSYQILFPLFIFLLFNCKEETILNYQAEMAQYSAINDVLKDNVEQKSPIHFRTELPFDYVNTMIMAKERYLSSVLHHYLLVYLHR